MERTSTTPNHAPEERVRHAVARVAALSCGCIDASTIIYAQKAGFFRRLEGSISLVSTAAVLSEAGYSGSSIALVQADRRLSPDDGLVAAARRDGLAVLTDDRKIVNAAKRAGLDCFNAVMLLHLLYLRGVVNSEEHHFYLCRLLQFAWYGPRIRAFADACYRVVLETLQESEGL
jgi:hypothetical protein